MYFLPTGIEPLVALVPEARSLLIAMASDQAAMSDNALFLVHYVRYGLCAYGPVEDVERAARRAFPAHRKYNEKALGLYAKRTGAGAEDLDVQLATAVLSLLGVIVTPALKVMEWREKRRARKKEAD